MKNTTNVFLKGMTSDMHPLTTSQQEYTDALNATLITFNGNEQMMQNDMGNTLIQDSKTGNIMGLREGFVPVGLKEHGGIMYIASVNKYGVGEIGTIPSPIIRYSIGDDTLNAKNEVLVKDNQITEYLIPISDTKLSPGEKFMVQLGLNSSIATEQFTNINFAPVSVKYPLASMIEYPGIYKINLYSITNYNNYLLDSIISKTQKYYLTSNYNLQKSDYWFINSTDELDFDTIKCSRSIESDGNTCMRSYPGNIPAGRLAIKAAYEEIESFTLIDRSDEFNIPYTWAKYTYNSDNNLISVNYYSYLSDFVYKTLSGIHIGKIIISATNSNGNIEIYNCADQTSYGMSAEFIVHVPNNESDLNIGNYSDKEQTIYFDTDDELLANQQESNYIFDLINTENTLIPVPSENNSDLDCLETHILSRYVRCSNDEHIAVFSENSGLASSQKSDASRYGICYLDLGSKFNQWITVKVDYYDQCDNKLGTYKLVFNPYVNDELHKVYNAGLEVSDSVNQYYNCTLENLDDLIPIIPNNISIDVNEEQSVGDSDADWNNWDYYDSTCMCSSANLKHQELLKIYSNVSFVGENNSDLKYLYDDANPHVVINVIQQDGGEWYSQNNGPWVKYQGVSAIGEYSPTICPGAYVGDTELYITLTESSSEYKGGFSENTTEYHRIGGECDSKIQSFQMSDYDNLRETFLKPGSSWYYYNSLLGKKYSASFGFNAEPQIEYGNNWQCSSLTFGFVNSITVSRDKSDTLPNKTEHTIIPYYGLTYNALDPDGTIKIVDGGIIYKNSQWCLEQINIDTSQNYFVSGGTEDMGQLYIMNGLDSITKSDSDHPNKSGSVYIDKAVYAPKEINTYIISNLNISLNKGAYMFNINYAADNARAVKFKVFDLILSQEYEITCDLQQNIFIPNVLIFPNKVIITEVTFLERNLVKGIFYNAGLYRIPDFDLTDYSVPTARRYIDSRGNYLCIPKSYFVFKENNIKCFNKTYNYFAPAPYAYGTHLIGSIQRIQLSRPRLIIDKLIYIPDNSNYSKTVMLNSNIYSILGDIGITDPSSIITYRKS